jgi:hypothetical protein
MHGPSAAPVSVLGPFASDSAPRDVYNLTIDGAHEFYANGVLVHNCDATRYLLINLGGGPSFPILDDPAENPFDEIERLQPLSVRFAFRPQDDDPAADEDPRPDQGATQLSPFA